MRSKLLADYSVARQCLLDRIAAALISDERYLAAWLLGSLGRGDGDEVSDIDLAVVVAPPYEIGLCARPWQVAPAAPPERLALFKTFGEPALIDENHHNARPGATLTTIIYAETALMIDFGLGSLAGAERPPVSRLLFDKVGIPIQPASEPKQEELMAAASEHVAFFWMMAAVACKYLLRGDGVAFYTVVGMLNRLVGDIHRDLGGAAWEWRRGPRLSLGLTRQEQVDSLRALCRQVEDVMPQVVAMGGSVSEKMPETISLLLKIKGARNKNAAVRIDIPDRKE